MAWRSYGCVAVKQRNFTTALYFFVPTLNYKGLLNFHFLDIIVIIYKILSIAHHKILYLSFFLNIISRLKSTFSFTKKTIYTNGYKEMLIVLICSEFLYLNALKTNKYGTKILKEVDFKKMRVL